MPNKIQPVLWILFLNSLIRILRWTFYLARAN